MAIPYLSPAGPTQIRYRCLAAHDCKAAGCPKYLSQSGAVTTLFNAHATLHARGPVFLCEGELDAVAVETLLGRPAVGLPGVQAWARHRHFPRVFVGLDLILPIDGDDAGRALATAVARDLPEVRVVQLPDGEDANSVLARDPSGFARLCGLPPAAR